VATTGLKKIQIAVLGAGLFFLLLEPQCKPSVLLQGASWYISAHPAWAAVFFFKPRFKFEGGRGEGEDFSELHKSISPLLFSGGIWIRLSQICQYLHLYF